MDNWLRKDIVSGATYYGYAPIGASPDANVWIIKKELISGTQTIIQYPSGLTSRVVWNSRSGYTYS